VAVSRTDLVLLGVGVAAVSTSAPLIRQAHAPALAVAFWRNALAAAVIVPAAGLRGRRRRAGRRQAGRSDGARAGRPAPGGAADAAPVGRPAWQLSVVAGVLLAAHFATWIPSLSLTSVSASVALVATQPVWAALGAGAVGHPVGRATWAGIGVALAGVVLLTGVAVGSSGRALAGDALALAGGALAAAYLTVGAAARRRVSTTTHTAWCYTTAAVVLAGACLAGGQHLAGFRWRTWACLAAITVGPQLLGHSVFNRVVGSVGATAVSVAVLGEIVGASLLALWWFGEVPPAAIVPAGVLIGAGVVLVVRRADAGEAVGAATAAA